MIPLPALFISHGAPDLPIRDGATQHFLKQLRHRWPKPRAILMISAHWLTSEPTVSLAPAPKTVYDFSGFPAELYQLMYGAPGDPTLAQQIATRLRDAGFAVDTHVHRGFDHGVWTPLILAWPEATIPVVQLSVQPRQGPAHHLRIGEVLAPMRSDGVLIIGSGAATHNLAAFGPYDARPPVWVEAFDDWLAAAIHRHGVSDLLAYRQLAPYAHENHPTEEHLLPLFVALGAGGEGQQIHRGFTYSAFSMAAFAFGLGEAGAARQHSFDVVMNE